MDDANQCKIDFYQGAVTDLDLSQDDRTLSDDMLATIASPLTNGVTREDVATYAGDDAIPRFGPGTVPVRTIWATADDKTGWLVSARMFGSLGGGVIVWISCPPGQDASVEYQKLVDNYLHIDVGPASNRQ